MLTMDFIRSCAVRKSGVLMSTGRLTEHETRLPRTIRDVTKDVCMRQWFWLSLISIPVKCALCIVCVALSKFQHSLVRRNQLAGYQSLIMNQKFLAILCISWPKNLQTIGSFHDSGGDRIVGSIGSYLLAVWIRYESSMRNIGTQKTGSQTLPR